MPRVEVVGEMNMNWEFGLGRCKLLQLQRVKNKVLLCSSWNYIDYFVINHKGKEYKNMHTYNGITLLYSGNEHNTAYINKNKQMP